MRLGEGTKLDNFPFVFSNLFSGVKYAMGLGENKINFYRESADLPA